MMKLPRWPDCTGLKQASAGGLSCGLIAIDNVLWNGAVIDPAKNDVDTQAIRNLNIKLSTDQRVSLSMVPIGDGLTLARVR
jgi:caffeoyl-CoA O-methyltransferase